jgi:biotin carboxylase
MTQQRPLTFLCIAFFYKGMDFLRACKAEGHRVFLLTKESLKDNDWPHEAIDEMYYMDSSDNSPENLWNILKGVAFLLKNHQIDSIVALDDYDVEKAAYLREHFRIPGMGQTTSYHFRDKLAMRMRARDAGIRVPAFNSLFNDEAIRQYLDTHEGPWLIKPRSEAAAAGIKKVHNADEVWTHLEKLGEKRHQFLIEQFRPGDVYHADALKYNGKMQFCSVARYLDTPFEVAHGGGIFRSGIVAYGGEDEKGVKEMNEKVLKAFGLKSGASHSEYIKNREDGEFYFLETSSRVGGAHLAEMVEMASGINLWTEWAKIEAAAMLGADYQVPEARKDYAGIIISLSKYELADYGQFSDPEVVWRLNKKHHVGVIVRSDDQERIVELLDNYAQIIYHHFHASAPAPDSAQH